MIKLTDIQIKEIADELDSGMLCYFNVKSHELLTTINMDRFGGMGDDELWQDAQDKIDEQWSDLVEIVAMESHDSFRVMENFTESLDDKELQDRLFFALRGPNPFRNFKYIIDNAGDYRQKWFDYQAQQYVAWVEDQVNEELGSGEEEDE